jgi:flagellar basal-body rod modification protein FlgD
MEVNSVVNATAGQVAQKDSSAANADRFLTMLVAQLKNQDPLNPLDNAQVTTQMAQISTVEGINKLNATLQAMSLGFTSSQTLQAASLVGRQVMTEGSTLQLAGGVAQGGYQLEGHADGLTLTVRSASGAVIHKAELGAQEAGIHGFHWDGMTDSGAAAAPGTYTFEVAARAGKEPVKATTMMIGRVDGVTPAADGTQLDLGALGTTSFGAVKHIF